MSMDERIKAIAEENAIRDVTHPIGAVYKEGSKYWRVCNHDSKTTTLRENGITKRIRSGFTSVGITNGQYRNAVWHGKEVKK